MSSEITVIPASSDTISQTQVVDAAEVMDRIRRVRQIMESCMVDGSETGDGDFGIIKGCQKRSLWLAGAEKLAFAFGVSARSKILDMSTPAEASYRVTCEGYHGSLFLGEASGECSSSEEKWAWRAPVSEEEWRSTPETMRRTKDTFRGPKHQVRTDPTTIRNTVLKMAEKRAFVGMIRRVTMASSLFSETPAGIDSPDEPGGDRQAAPPPLRRPQAVTPTRTAPPRAATAISMAARQRGIRMDSGGSPQQPATE